MFGSKRKGSGKRFDVVHYESHAIADSTRILVDRHTGVCYLHHQSGPAGGLTVLVDADGKPLLDHNTDD